MASNPDNVQRDVLPIPDKPHEGLVTYDAKDPDTSFPPIEPLRPTGGRVRPSTVAFMGWFGPRGLASINPALVVVTRSPSCPRSA